MDRTGGVALWRQVADSIRQTIAAGEFDARMMLPPETELAVRYAVNRHTVRSALAALATEGVVRPVQGVGTMIRPSRKLKLPLTRRTRFSEGIGTQAKGASAILLSHRLAAADSEIAFALGLAEGTSCIVLETTHSADGIPVSTATNWFEASRFHELPNRLRETNSISTALTACGVADYVRVSTEISAAHVTSEDIQRLNLSPGAIILETRSVNADVTGKPIQFARSRFNAGRSTLVISFETDGA